MKITIKHLGALEQAEFTLADLTIICGNNNSGKTYATYALYGFLTFWRRVFSIDLSQDKIDELLSKGSTRIDLRLFLAKVNAIVTNGCDDYAKRLPSVFAAPSDRFKSSQFKVEINPQDFTLTRAYEQRVQASKGDIFLLSKEEQDDELVVTLLVEREKFQLPQNVVRSVLADAIKEIIFGRLLPQPFIASAERTGAAIFRKELNFARNRLLEEVSKNDCKKINPFELLSKSYQDYALPVKANVDFTRDLESLIKKKSFIAEHHSKVLEDFADIIGGEYNVSSDDVLSFIPKGKRIRLSMDESSSAVRSLLDLGFYLRHVAKPGDLLMVDEPELNLHPENQRRVARLFARLIQLGIKVFITTHSDYIIKELNTLIMLGRKDIPRMLEIAKREGYKPEEMLTTNQVRVYIAEQTYILKDGNQKRSKGQTLTEADISPEFGIEARSFDTTIDEMNRIQDEIIWGGQ
jgi:hypothetical protein